MEGPDEAAADEAAQPGGPADEQAAALVAQLATAPPEERQELLGDLVLHRARAILDGQELDEDSNFLQNNMSSLAAVRLSKTLTDDTGLEVPLVAIVEHPTPTLLGKYLAEAYEAETG